MISDRLGEGAKNDPRLGKLRLEGRCNRNGVENGVDRHPRLLNSREDLLLDKRDAEFRVRAQQLRINLVERLRHRSGFWRGAEINLLVVDRWMVDGRPVGRRG